MDSDNVLQRHRARFESHRQWLKEQQASLNSADAQPMLHTPASARSAPASGLGSGMAQPNKSGATSVSYAAGNEAPPYSQAQRVQRTAAAAEWVDQTVNQHSREPLSRDREEGQLHSTSSWAQHQQQSVPTTARSYGGSAAFQAPPSSRSHPSYEDSRYGLPNNHTNEAHHQDQADGEEQGDGDEDHGSQHASVVYFEGSPLHVYSRATQWAKRKQQKLIELREAVDHKEVAECPFKPNTAKTRASSGAPSRLQKAYDPSHSNLHDSSFNNNGNEASSVASVSGWEEFMCRRLRAKQLLDEKKTRLRSDGSGWTGAPTVVEEFSLGVGVPGRRLQKVLKQPVAAPHGGTRAAVGATLMMPAQGGFSHHGNASTTPRANTVNNYSISGRQNTSSIYASPSPIPRAADVPTEEDRALPPKGLFSLRGSSTFVEGMSNSKAPYSAAEVFE